MSKKLGFFPYDPMNYKAAQRWLDRKAESGWGLKHVYLGCIALLEKGDAPKHFVDLDMRTDGFEDVDPEYLHLCSDAGWELVQKLRGMLLFRAAQGKSPAPIQTDDEMEWEQYWEKYKPKFWENLIGLAGIGLFIFLINLPSSSNVPAAMASYADLFLILYWTLSLICSLTRWIYSKWYLTRCRRAEKIVLPSPATTFLDAESRLCTPLGCLLLLCLLLNMVYQPKTVELSWSVYNEEYTATVAACHQWPVVLGVDLGLPDGNNSRHLEGFGTVLVDFLKYWELVDGPEGGFYAVDTERYECLSEPLAKFVFALRERETRRYYMWDIKGLPWEPAPDLGFDQSYVCKDGAYLLFRQGKTVAFVRCTGLDITTEQHLAAVRERVLGQLP